MFSFCAKPDPCHGSPLAPRRYSYRSCNIFPTAFQSACTRRTRIFPCPPHLFVVPSSSLFLAFLPVFPLFCLIPPQGPRCDISTRLAPYSKAFFCDSRSCLTKVAPPYSILLPVRSSPLFFLSSAFSAQTYVWCADIIGDLTRPDLVKPLNFFLWILSSPPHQLVRNAARVESVPFFFSFFFLCGFLFFGEVLYSEYFFRHS